MKNRAASFQRLQWKLTLSYTLVTVVTIFILATLMVAFTNRINNNTPQYGVTLAIALQDASADLANTFQSSTRDADLQAWVARSVVGNSVLLNNMNAGQGGVSFAAVASSDTLLAVVDAGGQTLAANHADLAPAGQPLSAALSTEASDLLTDALEPSNRGKRLWFGQAGDIVAAAPLFSADGDLVGAVFLHLLPASQLTLLGISLLSVLPATLLIGIGAGLIGTLFGALTARGLTRRLKDISDATLAWGQGHFTPRIRDGATDEIGRLSADLNHMAGELQTLLRTRQDLAAAVERNRLARDLHDSVKQQVFAARMNLGAVQTLWERHPEQARAQLEAAIALVSQAQQELNALIQTLRPVELDSKGLATALRELGEVWQRQSGIPVACQVAEESSAPPEIEETLYRIAQEGLSNAARHSGARAIRVELSTQGKQAVLTIQDDGHGFDPSVPGPGMGLRSMRERAQACQGDFHLDSAPGGTCLRVTIPFPEASHA